MGSPPHMPSGRPPALSDARCCVCCAAASRYASAGGSSPRFTSLRMICSAATEGLRWTQSHSSVGIHCEAGALVLGNSASLGEHVTHPDKCITLDAQARSVRAAMSRRSRPDRPAVAAASCRSSPSFSCCA